MKKIVFFFVFIINLICFTYAESNMRGIWVASVYNLDYPYIATTNESALKSETVAILNDAQKLGINAVFLQVRPTADSLYNSKIFPWSKYLTGKNGLAPSNNFDPLSFWVEEAHKRGIELHAWINPYRITKNGDEDYNNLVKNHPAKLHPEYVVKYSDGNYYFNPGIPEVRKLVIDGALEIVKNYNVDGLHMDDYFYPGTSFNDSDTYKKYGKGFSNIDDWRRNNVNLLVKELGEKLHEVDNTISYGISPAGIWANSKNNSLGSNTSGTESYYSHYADSRKWVINNWIDYIAPQIYWESGNKSADYTILKKWWEDVCKNSNTKLYIGLADYKSIDANKNSTWYNGKEIINQMKLNKESNIIDGEIHYRYSSVIAEKDLFNAIKSQYKDREIQVWVKGDKVKFDQNPVIENGRTLVPFRAIFETLGSNVNWSKNTVTATKGNIKIKLQIGSNKMYVNDKVIMLDVSAKIKNSRTLVPLRAVSEAFNNKVDWNGETKTVIIN